MTLQIANDIDAADPIGTMTRLVRIPRLGGQILRRFTRDYPGTSPDWIGMRQACSLRCRYILFKGSAYVVLLPHFRRSFRFDKLRAVCENST
jgi:hypothetical protein